MQNQGELLSQRSELCLLVAKSHGGGLAKLPVQTYTNTGKCFNTDTTAELVWELIYSGAERFTKISLLLHYFKTMSIFCCYITHASNGRSMYWFSPFMSLSVCMTTARQLVVTGSDTALRVSVYSVPTITRHQLLWIRASWLSCLLKYILSRLRSAPYFLHLQVSCQITLSVFRRGWYFSLCVSHVLSQFKTSLYSCWNKKWKREWAFI